MFGDNDAVLKIPDDSCRTLVSYEESLSKLKSTVSVFTIDESSSTIVGADSLLSRKYSCNKLKFINFSALTTESSKIRADTSCAATKEGNLVGRTILLDSNNISSSKLKLSLTVLLLHFF